MDITITAVQPRQILGIRETVALPGQLFSSALPVVFGFAGSNGMAIDGAPLGIYYEVEEGSFDMAVAVAFTGPLPMVARPMFVGSLPGGRVAWVDHVGPYETISQTWSALIEELGSRGVQQGGGPSWEEYQVGPETTSDPSAFRTRLVTPIL